MKDKIISWIIWAIIWWIIVFWYWQFFSSNADSIPQMWGWQMWPWWNFDASSMTDEQLSDIAQKAWITLDELKQKLDSGESLRDIMPMREGRQGNSNWTWSTMSWNISETK